MAGAGGGERLARLPANPSLVWSLPAPPIVSEALPGDVPEPSPEPSASPAPVVGEEGLAIVGTYESGGTSYVMYSDGSIEARTEHEVVQFKSMAELKAFMESQA
jgi:hypothetical protein